MSAAPKRKSISVDEYLAVESKSTVKHEYLGGAIHAMAGASNAHNRIAGNVFGRLHAQLWDKPCQPWNSDAKVRVRLPTHDRFYYPDVSVVCQPNPPEDQFHDLPVIIVEVLSRSTRRIDQGEKKDAYLTIPSLAVYLMIESESAGAVVYRRTAQGFVREEYDGMDAHVPLSEIDVELRLAEAYKGVVFVPEPEGGDDT